MYISSVHTVAKAHLFTGVFLQLSIVTAHYLCHPIQMTGTETIAHSYSCELLLCVHECCTEALRVLDILMVTKCHSTADIKTNILGNSVLNKLPHFGQGYASYRALLMLE